MFFASNYFYAYQQAINAAKFDGPTRALVATIEGVGAIVGALIVGYFILDAPYIKSRRMRGYFGVATITTLIIIVWAIVLSWQVTFDRADAIADPLISYKDPTFRGKAAMFFFRAYIRGVFVRCGR